MTRRPWSVAVLLGIVLVVAVAVWAVSTRTRPSFAVYDSVPERQGGADAMPRAPADTITAAAGGVPVAPPPAPSLPVSRKVPVPARGDSADSSGARPHRSDNYGGYSGYGSKERRGDPNGR